MSSIGRFAASIALAGASLVIGCAALAATEDRALDDFDGVSAKSSIEVLVVCGAKAHVEITASPDSLLADVKSDVVSGGLALHISGSHFGTQSVKAVVTTTKPLSAYAAASSAHMTVATCAVSSKTLNVAATSSGIIAIGGKAEKLNAVASSSGRIVNNEGNGLIADDANLAASSSGLIQLAGIAHEIHAAASSSGQIADSGNGGLTADHADIAVSSSGHVSLCKVKSASVAAASSGEVALDRNTEIRNQTLASSGHVSRDACR